MKRLLYRFNNWMLAKFGEDVRSEVEELAHRKGWTRVERRAREQKRS